MNLPRRGRPKKKKLRSEKQPDEHLKNCRPHLPQFRSKVHDSQQGRHEDRTAADQTELRLGQRSEV